MRFHTLLKPRTYLTQLNYFNLLARVMKLVDMLGLKPRPSRGPGSTPGTGNILIFNKLAIMLSASHPQLVLTPPTLLPLLRLENSFLLLTNQPLFFHLLFSYVLLLLFLTLTCFSIRQLLSA